MQQATFQFEDMYVEALPEKAELGGDLTNYEKRLAQLIVKEVVQNPKQLIRKKVEAEEGATIDRYEAIRK